MCMSCIIKGQRTGEFLNNAFWTITVCNTTINTTSVRRKISAKLTLNCIQLDRKQKPRSTWQVKLLLQPMIFRQHRRCRSLTFASTITPDCERDESRNTGNQCWTHLCPVRHFLVRSEVRREGHVLFTMIVDGNNNKHRCWLCPSKSRALFEVPSLTECQHSVYYCYYYE